MRADWPLRQSAFYAKGIRRELLAAATRVTPFRMTAAIALPPTSVGIGKKYVFSLIDTDGNRGSMKNVEKGAVVMLWRTEGNGRPHRLWWRPTTFHGWKGHCLGSHPRSGAPLIYMRRALDRACRESMCGMSTPGALSGHIAQSRIHRSHQKYVLPLIDASDRLSVQ